ncbi:GNAT family N-acetyltransferase [Bacillus sp. RG28]|uniref:GNAT family N-acetyltransferase n=1 Tax=Gottfriedia endophytica TaxID=2820819 RepID=A0A940NQS7_9BACI|nr:GNAT family N-acetyltransferase [Gottfriedia endophytica]MBP0726569.1 GNAT family N-acetyltransferase [Gottfriedia endophytica]
MFIREIKVEDAERFVELIKEVESKADFMLMEAGERKITSEQQRKQLEQIEKRNNSTIFVAEQEEKLVGYLIVIGGSARRTKHSAYLVIGILKDYRGCGIGTKLFKQLEEWAKAHNILRLELSVVTQNIVGLSLYKKMGFEIEGTKRNSLIIDNKFFNEYFMAKLL